MRTLEQVLEDESEKKKSIEESELMQKHIDQYYEQEIIEIRPPSKNKILCKFHSHKLGNIRTKFTIVDYPDYKNYYFVTPCYRCLAVYGQLAFRKLK